MKKTCIFVLILLSLLVTLSACNLPGAATKVVMTAVPNTPTVPANTPVPPTSVPPTITPTPTAIPARYRGFWMQEDNVLRAYDFNGASLGMEINISGANKYLSPWDYQVVNNTAYYYNSTTQQAFRSTVGGGAPTLLAFIPSAMSIPMAVSLDNNKIAWSTEAYSQTEQNPSSKLWLANIDGSNVQEIVSLPSAGNDHWLVLRPLRWTEDGQLLYTTNMTGIGGYILFYGFNSLLRYNPADGSSTLLAGDTFGLCLNEISPDQTLVGAGCGPDHAGGVNIIRVGSGAAVSLPSLPDQGQAGSVTFSPDGLRVAYAIARGTYDNEFGQIVIAPVDGSIAPQVITSFGPGFYTHVQWIDDQTLLLERDDLTGGAETITLWRINVDGSGLTQTGIGYLRGFVPNP